MSNVDPWQFDLEGYLREAEPDAAERADAWQTGIGLQAVDGLPVSDYLLYTAKEHIDGGITIDEVQRRITDYYQTREDRCDLEAEDTKEGDIVSSRIAQLLGERAFTFSPVQLQTIHRRLFDQLLPHAGKYRDYNITKKEWVLKSDTVYYASYDSIEDTLRYDFAQEQEFDYVGISVRDVACHIARFISDVWQIHPFGEGNTRTTAVFAIKYLRAMGYEVNNDPYRDHSWYFRNALVRANYEDVSRGISPTTTYLERFFQNQLCGTHYKLKNRYLHIDWPQREDGEVTRQDTDQDTDQVTDQVRALLAALGDEELSAKELMNRLGLSHRPTFRQNYLNPALAAGLVERTIPNKPTSRLQRYRRARR